MNQRILPRGTGVAAVSARVALGAAILVLAVAAAPANGAIKIYETSEAATLLGKIKKGECRVRGSGANRHFRATAKSTNRAYELSLTILDWRGYGRDYDFRSGTNDPGVFYLNGPGGPYSSIFSPPGAEGIPAGGVRFARGGDKLGVGFLPTPNQSFRKGVVLAGMMRCRG